MKEKILLFIPAYNCEHQISRVLIKLASYQDTFTEFLIVDNRSTDKTIEKAFETISALKLSNATVIKNDENYSLGGSHKVAFNYAVANKFDFVGVYHGDDQADINDLVPLIKNGLHHQFDCLLGSRFHKNAKLLGYSKFRTFGNILLNLVCDLVCQAKILDQGSGLNFYKTSYIADKRIQSFPDNLTFNVYLLYHGYFSGAKTHFFPISWREEDQISNAKVFRQGWHILQLSARTIFTRDRLYNGKLQKTYTSQKQLRQP